MKKEVIKTIALTKYYGKSRGIADINLVVNEGDFFGFIGPNGAGKSTTIRTILGFISPTKGTIEIFGKNFYKERNEILSEIGYMPSEADFYRNMKVSEVISYSAKLRCRDCKKEAEQLCERLEVAVNKKIGELSLGNRKKVSIVCALQHNPKLCIFDEPTSGLDPLMQKEFYNILSEKNKQGTTIFLSSHILTEIQHYCKNAAFIKNGKILVSGSINDIGHTYSKKVTIKGVNTTPLLNGIKNVNIENDGVKFLYDGNPQELLKALSLMPIKNINISEPDLEEIFMQYYKGDSNDNNI